MSDVRHGKGRYTKQTDGSVLEGVFNFGKIFKGKHTKADGTILEGEFKYDELRGQGTVKYADGSFYHG